MFYFGVRSVSMLTDCITRGIEYDTELTLRLLVQCVF